MPRAGASATTRDEPRRHQEHPPAAGPAPDEACAYARGQEQRREGPGEIVSTFAVPPHAYERSALASDGLPAVPSPASIHAWPDRMVPRARPRRGWRIFFSVIGLLLLAACALTILILIGINTGRTGFLLGAVLATLPVPLLVAAFRWLDKYEPEPARYLVFAFVWGAAVATLVAITLNTVGTAAFFARPGDSRIGWEAVLLARRWRRRPRAPWF